MPEDLVFDPEDILWPLDPQVGCDLVRERLARALDVPLVQVRTDATIDDLGQRKVAGTIVRFTLGRMIGGGVAFDGGESIGDVALRIHDRRVGTVIHGDLDQPHDPALTRSPVRLRPVRDSDIPDLYEAALDPGSSFRWRFRGSAPSPQQFRELTHRGVLAQFIVEHSTTTAVQGVVIAYDPMPENGLAFLAMQRTGPPVEGGEMTIGMFHLVDLCFRRWDLRKLYADMPEFNLRELGDAAGLLVEEARLKDFGYYDGRYWDRVFLALGRDVWLERSSAWRAFLQDGLVGRPERPAEDGDPELR